jgi:hypothetical protein
MSFSLMRLGLCLFPDLLLIVICAGAMNAGGCVIFFVDWTVIGWLEPIMFEIPGIFWVEMS